MQEEEVKLSVLIAEDDDAAAHLIKTNIKRMELDALLFRAKNGEELIHILSNQHPMYDEILNTKLVILLDIRMPKVDGLRVLEYIKRAEELKQIPVIMLTTTHRPMEIRKCYELGCNFFIRKQVDYQKFVEAIKNFGNFIKVCEIPIFGEVTNE